MNAPERREPVHASVMATLTVLIAAAAGCLLGAPLWFLLGRWLG